MKHKQLQYFIKVVECGSISAAAKQLYISQPSLSRIIHSLEQEMGTPLLHRTSRGVELTSTGKQMYYYSSAIEDKFLMLERLKGLDGQQLVSRLHVTMADFYLGEEVISKFYQSLQSCDTEFFLQETTLEPALDQVCNLSSEFALAVVNDHQLPVFTKIAEAKELTCTVLDKTPMCLHMHKDHPLLQQLPLTAERIQQYPNLHLPYDFFSNLNQQMPHFQQNAKSSPCRMITTNNYRTILHILQQSESYTLGNTWQAKELARFDIETIQLKTLKVQQNLILVHRSRESLSDPAKSFLQIFLNVYQLSTPYEF